jgi:glycosyltransferase involved in cell wall biosynthesis
VETDNPDDDLFRVVYYGTFIPNHGVKYIVEAARILQDESDIHFELIGKGPTKAEAVALAEKYGLENVTFVDWVDKQDLPHRVAKADVCLGVFGTTPQSMMTVQNKIYEGLAMSKPVITGASPTVHSSLIHGKHLYLCERANPQALAEAVRVLNSDSGLYKHIAENGFLFYHSQFDLQHNGTCYALHLHELIKEYA